MTFTTTRSPECSFAPWTWAIEADAKASASNSAYSSSGLRPSSASIVAFAQLDERGAQLGEHQPDARLQALLAQALAAGAAQAILDPVDVEPAQPVGEAVLGEHGHDLADAARVALQATQGVEGHAGVGAVRLSRRRPRASAWRPAAPVACPTR
jgi:hypothetical protein